MITERDFAMQVEDLLTRFGWQWVHLRPGRVSRGGKETYETPYSGHKGFLDYLALRPPRIVIAEVKSDKGKMTPDQQAWFSLWEDCQRAFILRPLEIAHGKASIKLDKLDKPDISVLPEIYLWRPDDFDKIVDLLR